VIVIFLLLCGHILLVKEVKICRPLFFSLVWQWSAVSVLSASLSAALKDGETAMETFVLRLSL
jgi:hypothetical protein